MGVHNKEVYPEVKRLLGIPEDEPIFILRAQDKLAPGTVEAYTEFYSETLRRRGIKTKNASPEQMQFTHSLVDTSDEMYEWQDDHGDKVKIPD